MSAREAVYLLVLTGNPDLVELYRQDCPECVVTIAKDVASAVRKVPKHRFDAVIIESHKDWATEMKLLSDALGGGSPDGAGWEHRVPPSRHRTAEGLV